MIAITALSINIKPNGVDLKEVHHESSVILTDTNYTKDTIYRNKPAAT